MSVLQELQKDNTRMLKRLGITRKKENQFLQEKKLFLNDILYNEKNYNDFIKWLKNEGKKC